MRNAMAYIQLGISTVIIASIFVGMAKVIWVLTGTSYNHTALLLAQVIQGAILAIPLRMAKNSLDIIKKHCK